MTVCERFLKNIENHELIIENDDNEFNRSILCKKSDSWNYYFRIVTYRGGLLITGDMGSWCFERETDMFNFFRGEEINFDYWAEKLVSYDARRKPFEFDDDLFTKEVVEDFENYFDDDIEERPGLLRQFSDWVESYEYYNNAFHRIVEVKDFCDEHNLPYGDFMEMVHNAGRKPNSHLEWCMNAIIWVIAEYDKLTKKESERNND
jgi:hypothetical protein